MYFVWLKSDSWSFPLGLFLSSSINSLITRFVTDDLLTLQLCNVIQINIKASAKIFHSHTIPQYFISNCAICQHLSVSSIFVGMILFSFLYEQLRSIVSIFFICIMQNIIQKWLRKFYHWKELLIKAYHFFFHQKNRLFVRWHAFACQFFILFIHWA